MNRSVIATVPDSDWFTYHPEAWLRANARGMTSALAPWLKRDGRYTAAWYDNGPDWQLVRPDWLTGEHHSATGSSRPFDGFHHAERVCLEANRTARR